ncbi:unnamed protein product [Cercospora beticola]|nr:unnamed protein product [Cercospora beticola]
MILVACRTFGRESQQLGQVCGWLPLEISCKGLYTTHDHGFGSTSSGWRRAFDACNAHTNGMMLVRIMYGDLMRRCDQADGECSPRKASCAPQRRQMKAHSLLPKKEVATLYS